MAKIKYWLDWLFRDQTERRGKYVIAEVPNWPLLVFMLTVILGVIQYPGFFQKFLLTISFIALIYWGFKEFRGGRSRFRRLLGILGILASIGAVLLTFIH